MKQIKLPKIRKYHVLIPQGKSIATDNPNLAEKKAILASGTVYENIRYNAEKRLQRLYFRAASLNRLPNEIDYPHLIEIV
jgi:hypothetical protein